jgi:hypothetical protein
MDTYAHVLPDMQRQAGGDNGINPAWLASVSNQTGECRNQAVLLVVFGIGVDDGVRTRDFRSHSPALCH